jgi:glycosyltransferase involved in cell wall biosynthesis
MAETRVLIDGSPLVNHFQNRGVGNLTFSLLRKLLKNDEIRWQIIAPGTKNKFREALGGPEYSMKFDFFSLGEQEGFLKKIFRPVFFKFQYEHLIKKINPDVFISLEIEKGLPGKSVGFPRILMVHDITPLRIGSFSQKNYLANEIKKRNYNWALEKAKSADKIIAISDFTKRDLVREGFSGDKVEVVHLAVPEKYKMEVENVEKRDESFDNIKRRTLNIYNITEPYIFYLGGLEKNKNVVQLVRSFAQIVDKFPELKLVIGGSEFKLDWSHKAIPLNERARELVSLVDEMKLNHRVIFTGFIESQHLPVIYKCAECFVHLSKYEGFGLNVLEPQVVGTPVVASDRTTYPEVLSDSALLVDPDDTSAVADAISSLLNKSEDAKNLRSELVKKGKENIARFSWKKTAEEMMKVVQELVTKPDQNKPKKLHKQKIDKKTKSSRPIKSSNKKNKDTDKKKRDKKKAVILATYFEPFIGGMENVAKNYAEFLKDLGYEVHVITSDRKAGKVVIKKHELIGGIHVHRLKRQGKNYYFYRLKGLYSKLKEIDPEIIHAQGLGFLWHDLALMRFRLSQRRLTKDKKVLMVNTPHGPFMSKPESGLRKIFKKIFTFIQARYVNRIYDLMISENKEQSIWMNEDYKVDNNKIEFVPPVMPETKLKASRLRKIKEKDHIQISSISRLADYKGFDDILYAYSEINTAIKTKLYIAGAEENFQRQIEHDISKNPRKEDITFETNISEKRKEEMLRKTDIFILASNWEAFGIVIAEAMSYGAAILSSDTEGGRFLVREGENGYIFKYKDVKALIKYINELVINEKILRSFQEKSLELSGQYSKDKVKQIYQDIILENIKK